MLPIPELMPDPSIGVFTERYKPLKRLGRGGYGEVLLTQDAEGGYHAVKRALDSRKVASLQREALALSCLRHPGVVGLETLFADERHFPVLVMEYCPGKPLTKKIAQQPWNEAQVWRLAFDLAEIVRYVHSQGVLHLDIKPENILCQEEALKLLDFGLAKLEGIGLDGFSQTLGYGAPELCRGIARPESDYYSMGVSLCACLQGTSVAAEIFSRPLRIASTSLAKLLYGLLSERPSDRQQAFDML